jgi:hypothetical protein
MRMPRVHDFDPDAKIPELGSPMDNFPSIQKPKQPTDISINSLETEVNKPKQPPVPPVPPVRVVPPVLQELPIRTVLPVPPKKRVMKQRHPFDIYQDQYESLKQLADKERRQGGAGSMSAMAREALDTYIAKRRVGK